MVEYSNEANHDSIIRWKEESLEKRKRREKNNKNNDTLQ